MNFKLVSKNNVGVVLILLLVIILSQNRTLNFLIDTYLGRIFLIALLLIVGYCNKILGIVFVFIIIISFNMKPRYLEGLTTETTQTASNETKQDIKDKKKDKREEVINDVVLNGPKPHLYGPGQPQVPPNASSQTTVTPEEVSTTESAESAQGVEAFTQNINRRSEGFDLVGAENAIKRGKQSNSIPVSSFSRTYKNVLPVDSKTLFNHNYSMF
jgi:hypothetical protein